MDGYIDYQLDVDPAAIRARMVAAYLARGFAGDESDPGLALVETIGLRIGQTQQLLVDFAAAVFRDFGRKVYGITPIARAAATIDTTWTATNAAGYTIPAGTIASYPIAGDRQVAFRTVDAHTIPPGQTSVDEVTMAAVVGGIGGNGLPAGAQMTNTEQLAWVASILTDTASSGGVDAETDGEYRDRLVGEIRAASTGGLVLPADFATAARSVAGVARALVIPGHDPDTDTFDNDRTVDVRVVDADGASLSSTVKDQVQAELHARREANFIVHVGDPDTFEVDVTFEAVAVDGTDVATVQAAAVAAVEAHLAKGRWAGGDQSPPVWRDEPTIRYFDLAHVIEATPDLDHLTTLTINGGTSDVTMTGVAPLPEATVDGTVT